MEREFDLGFTFVMDNFGSSFGRFASESWIENIDSEINRMCEAMLIEAERRPNTDVDHLQGWLNEIWHKHTYNINAKIHLSKNVASIPDASTFASVDNLIKDKHGNELARFSLKSDNSASASLDDQSKTPWEHYCEKRKTAERKGKGYQSFEEFLKKNKIINDERVNLSMYLDQGKVVDTEYLAQAKQMAYEKYLEALAKSNGILTTAAKRYLEVYNTLTDVISDHKGNESIPLTHDQAIKLATAAKEAKIDKELLKECNLDIDKLITPKDIAREAFSAGLTAATISLMISVVPVIISAVSKLIHDGSVTADDLKKYGLKSLTDSGRSFLNGTVTAAIVTCCKTGKFGEALVNANTMAIASLVTVSIGTIMSGLKCASGKISKSEMAREIIQMYTTSVFAFVGGSVLTCICHGFPLAYMLGSIIGSIVGGFIYKAADHIILSFCKEHDCTFFGLVEQDYKLPEGVLNEIGLDEFGFEGIKFDIYEADKFECDKFSHDSYEYEKFGIRVLRRDLIGVYRIGYV